MEIILVTIHDFAPQGFVFNDLAWVKVTELVPCALHQIHLIVETIAQRCFFLVHDFLTSLDVGLFCAVLLHGLELGLLVLELRLQRLLTVLDDCIALFDEVSFKLRHVFVTLINVNGGHKVRSEVDDLFKLLGLELFFWLESTQQVGQP